MRFSPKKATTTWLLLSLWRMPRRHCGSAFLTAGNAIQRQQRQQRQQQVLWLPSLLHHPYATTSTTARCAAAKPQRGRVVDSYQTVSVNCAKCGLRLFRYKKKNGTKSNLIKCYVERIVEDCENLLSNSNNNEEDTTTITTTTTPSEQEMDAVTTYSCPSCDTTFARSTLIRGLPALKLVGGKTRMTKK